MAERQNKIEKDNLNLLAKLEDIKKKGTMTSKVSAAFRLINRFTVQQVIAGPSKRAGSIHA